MTMQEAKAIIRRESIGKVVSQEEMDLFMKELTELELSNLVGYMEACYDMVFSKGGTYGNV